MSELLLVGFLVSCWVLMSGWLLRAAGLTFSAGRVRLDEPKAPFAHLLVGAAARYNKLSEREMLDAFYDDGGLRALPAKVRKSVGKLQWSAIFGIIYILLVTVVMTSITGFEG